MWDLATTFECVEKLKTKQIQILSCFSIDSFREFAEFLFFMLHMKF
jgi:hypothetical protein